MNSAETAEHLVDAVLESNKLRWIEAGFVRNVAKKELLSVKNEKERIKNVKSKIYQSAGAFRNERVDYATYAERFQHLPLDAGTDETKRAILPLLMEHASVKERILSLESFYQTLLADHPQNGRILDLACGLNPLTRPWMNLPKSATVDACDLYSDMVDLINSFNKAFCYTGHAFQHNLLEGLPDGWFDTVFLFKTIPCLEMLRKSAGAEILSALRSMCHSVIVTFPVQSLGGRKKGMVRNYENHFYEICESEQWKIEKFLFASELVFRLSARESNGN